MNASYLGVGFLGGQPFVDQIGDAAIDVELDLGVDVAGDHAAWKQPPPDVLPVTHLCSGERRLMGYLAQAADTRSTDATALACFSQRSTSRSRRRFPLAVRR